jgi:hypothetical protein
MVNKMKYRFLLLLIFIAGCSTQTKYITTPMSEPPTVFIIDDIKSDKQLIKSYQKSVIKITEWQKWYNIQVGSNYFKFTNQ